MLVLAPYYLWRMRRRGGYSDGFGQRFGAVPSSLPPKSAGRQRIWLQAVSVGELLAIGPLLDALHAQADREIYLTTTTSTGYRLAKERYGAKVAGVAYFPMDFWCFSARAWRHVQPDLAVLTEGERWPEHIHQAARRGVPIVAINARLSDRSFARMQWVRGLVPGLMGGITRLLAVAEEDAERFRQLGFASDRVTVTGNLKVDNAIAEIDDEAKQALRRELGFGPNDLVLLGSSLWPGEEEAVVAAWERARRDSRIDRTLRLLLVPRHAERSAAVEAIVAATGASYHLRSRGAARAPIEIAVGDTTGELQRLTQLADLVFVGKSLPPHTEGQTPVEAAGLGRALMFGPGMASFRPIAQDLRQQGAAVRVESAAELSDMTVALLADESRRNALGAAGRAWHRSNRGALARTVEVISVLLAD
ncbi:glycosyltransferase N-terminal domain-containing protein [Synoicihabitans lomoniglobus]|uniref:3-deoxy-D-manno-octulosonic acid transferase n=2 Tax=Synoicihabitans lomoniglobus TaxID=2909285 RepID=A0AAF0CT18_9BACT|nr:glycosyltransferase N-terminal domain-containing protein [Opitutaceae bacterium LMO-M01]